MIMEKEEVINGILHLLQVTAPTFDGLGHTFLQIREFLKLNNVQGYSEDDKSSILRLRELLDEMEEENFIEERHFEEKYNGRVDYALEQKGIELIEKIRKEAKVKGVKLDDKWKLID